MAQEPTIPKDSLEMRLGHEVPPEHYGILAAILNHPSKWGWLFQTTPELIRQRLQSGQIFVAAYGDKLPDESFEGADLNQYDGKIPITYLQTAAIRTEGRYDKVPRTWLKLTNSGLWAPIPEHPDTLIMADLTSIPSRVGVDREIGATINFTLKLLSGETDYRLPFDPHQIEHIWTYSPNRPGVMKMHTDRGATGTGFIIPDSRIPLENYDLSGRLGRVVGSLRNTQLVSYKG